MIKGLPLSTLSSEAQDGLYRALEVLGDLGVTLDPWNGPWIGGGSLLRAFVLGEWHPPKCDIDVFMRQDCDARVQVGRYVPKWDPVNQPGSLLIERGTVQYRGLTFDMLVGPKDLSLEHWLNNLPVYLTRIATDGKYLVVHEEFLFDIERKTIRTAGDYKLNERIAKYAAILDTFRPEYPPEPPEPPKPAYGYGY